MEYSRQVIMLFFLLSVFYSIACISGTKKLIKNVGIVGRRYPQGYIVPGRMFRKIFGLKKEPVPKPLYMEILMVIPIAILFVTSVLLCTLSGLKWAIFFWWIYGIVGALLAIWNVIVVIRYR